MAWCRPHRPTGRTNGPTRATAILCALLLAGCGGENTKAPEPPSDPTDAFYPKPVPFVVVNPPYRWHDRQPGRWFETTLRPWNAKARVPTAYLYHVTRNYQPWAKQIYDVARLYLDIDTLAPTQGTIGWLGPNDKSALEIELGGWSQTGARNAKLYVSIVHSARIVESQPDRTVIEEGKNWHKYLLNGAGEANADGNPVEINCVREMCDATLALIPEWTGASMLSGESSRLGKSTAGIALHISFDKSRLKEWPEIRRKAICFAAIGISDFSFEKAFPGHKNACSDVKAAMNRTIKE